MLTLTNEQLVDLGDNILGWLTSDRGDRDITFRDVQKASRQLVGVLRLKNPANDAVEELVSKELIERYGVVK